jgi:hypothetical protein
MPGAMTRLNHFAVDLAKAGRSFREIKAMVDSVYGDKGLNKTVIIAILKKVKEGKNADNRKGFPTEKWVITADGD